MRQRKKLNTSAPQTALVIALIALAVGALAYWRVLSPSPPGQPPSAAAADEVMKVVYHVDFADPRRFSAMLTNVNNMVTTFQNDFRDYDIRIVFVSYGIRFVTEDKLANTLFVEDRALRARRRELLDRLASLRDVQGVKLELCGITREQVGLAESKLIGGVTTVRSGVAQIAELQRQGFAYIKVE